MIDVENELFNTVAATVRAQFPNAFVTSEAVNAPSQFPCVCFFEDDNYTPQEALDSSFEERFAALRYRLDIYSNKAAGRKNEVKEILSYIEPLLYARNFTRDSRTPLNDMGDTIFHMVGTYRVVTDGEGFYRI